MGLPGFEPGSREPKSHSLDQASRQPHMFYGLKSKPSGLILANLFPLVSTLDISSFLRQDTAFYCQHVLSNIAARWYSLRTKHSVQNLHSNFLLKGKKPICQSHTRDKIIGGGPSKTPTTPVLSCLIRTFRSLK